MLFIYTYIVTPVFPFPRSKKAFAALIFSSSNSLGLLLDGESVLIILLFHEKLVCLSFISKCRVARYAPFLISPKCVTLIYHASEVGTFLHSNQKQNSFHFSAML